MQERPPSFDLSYHAGDIHFGRGCVDHLAPILDDRRDSRALIFCGSSTGASSALMDPIREALGDRLVGVYDGSTPAKHVETVYELARRLEEAEADVVVAVGGGATLDMARGVRPLLGRDRSLSALIDQIDSHEPVSVPPDPFPMVAIPTTLTGAGLSIVGGARQAATYPGRPVPESDANLGGYTTIDARLMADAIVYDPSLYETTPASVLANSAMNGFHKAIEMLYCRHATPITDGVAMRALRFLSEGLPELLDEPTDPHLDRAVLGTMLAQYGLAQPEAYRVAIIHGFGHGFSLYYDVQQGRVHGIVGPRVLEYVFEEVDGRRRLIAEGLGIDTAELTDADIAARIVERVTAIRDALENPSSLRAIDGLERPALPAIAEQIAQDLFMANNPVGLDPTPADIETILTDLWA